MESKAMEQYLSRLKRALTCSRPDREKLLAHGKGLLEGFLEENPEGGYTALSAAFGPPEAFAGEMLATLDQDALQQTQARRKLFQRAAALLAAVALALCAVFYAVKWYQAREIVNGDFRIVQEENIPVTDEDFNNIFGLDSEGTGENQP